MDRVHNIVQEAGIKPSQSEKRKGTSHHAWKKRVAQSVMVKANTWVKSVMIRQAKGICKQKQVSSGFSFLWKYNRLTVWRLLQCTAR